ncbi:MAG: hypothetical protein ABIF10_06505 [Candidatus Woesearchaeota archaeon]
MEGYKYLDESIYSEEYRQELLDDDEISLLEAGFMEGYEAEV